MNQKIFILLIVALVSGCSSTSQLKNGVDSSGSPVCLTDCSEIPLAVEKYMATHDLITERDEIDYLLYRIQSSHRRFIRNGMESDGTAASQFLRWKIGWYERRYHEKIYT